MQWSGVLLPRIQHILLRPTILELAPGHGRWTKFLEDLCRSLYLVDLSDVCISACRKRFGDGANIEYFVNDGRSLAMIPDEGVDFVFSFDSLVHAEADVIEAYLSQLSKILVQGGMGFIHHSNIGNCARYYRMLGWTPASLRRLVARVGPNERFDHWRAYSMTHQRFAEFARSAGLTCIVQELIPWSTRPLIDCISVFVKSDAPKVASLSVVENHGFDVQADCLKTYWNSLREFAGEHRE